jgi:hypothetical protein
MGENYSSARKFQAGFAFSFNGQHLGCGHGAFAKGD